MNVWEPSIQQPNEFSLSQLWILGGSFGEDLNSIEAGWQVSSSSSALSSCYWLKMIELINEKNVITFYSFLTLLISCHYSSSMYQVSPDLYGDNNTRLFTYWTVSPARHSNIFPAGFFDCHCFFCLPVSFFFFFFRVMHIKLQAVTTSYAQALFKSTAI